MAQTSGKVEFWRKRLARFERSGLTIRRFCEREGCSQPSFYQWRKRLAESAPAEPQGPPQGKRLFERVSLSVGVGRVAFRLPGGAQIDVPTEQHDAIRTVLGEILRADGESRTGDEPC